MEEEKKNLETKKQRRPLVAIMAVLLPCIVVLSVLFARVQMERLEEGVLELCAQEQDAYVELALAQLHQQAGDEEALTEWLLAAPDAPNGGYWAFSGEQTVFYVKDAQETNRYKGFTPATYFSTESAGHFFTQLQTNRVTHENIQLGEENYVASGALFTHQGRTYSLCLLRESRALLEGNSFMEAKLGLWLLLGMLLALLLMIPPALALFQRRIRSRLRAAEQDAAMLNERLNQVSARLTREDLHDTQNNLWKLDMLPKFILGLQKKNAAPVTFLRIQCASTESRTNFLSTAGYLLDRNVLRFEAGATGLILAFVGVERLSAVTGIQPLLSAKCVLKGVTMARRSENIGKAAQVILRAVDMKK